MIMDYDFDKMIEFGIEELNPDKAVVNPEYRKLTHRIKKEREKLQRLRARLYPLAEQAMDENIDKTPSISLKQMGIVEIAKEHQEKTEKLLAERKSIKSRIKLGEMKNIARYNKLKPESKLLICYRAETAMVNLIDDNFINEKRQRRSCPGHLQQNTLGEIAFALRPEV